MRVEAGVKLFQRPFEVTGALAHETFRFHMEHRRQCVKEKSPKRSGMNWQNKLRKCILFRSGKS